jgi:hypothetical protein
MSLSGVRSNRGDGYQTLVALDWALDVLTNDSYSYLEIDSTALDASGAPITVDDVVVGLADGGKICCQSKKNQTHFEAWGIADLADELNKSARLMHGDPKSFVRFYTRGSFGALAKLCEHSATQPNVVAYRQSLTKELAKTDADLASSIATGFGLSTFDFLRRTKFECTPELDRMQERINERLASLVSNPKGAFDALWTRLDMLGARMGNGTSANIVDAHRLTKTDLNEIVTRAGATIIPPRSEQELTNTFASASSIGRSWCRDIAGKRIPIVTVSELVDAVNQKERSVLLTGNPGAGKTCVLLELQDALEARSEIASLFIQAREFANCLTPEARAAQGLPTDLVGLIGRMADSKQSVVIVDSLDVLSLSRAHGVLEYFLAQIDRILLIKNVTVVVACRDFDRKYDTRISERKWDRTVITAPLDWDVIVAPIVGENGVNPETLDATTRALIQNPRELALFVDIARRTGGFNVGTSQALSQIYLRATVQNDPALGNDAMTGIEQMAHKMLVSRRLDVPRTQVQLADNMVTRLLSAGVLHQTATGNLEFGHQTLLDVLVISGAERSELTLKALIEKLPAVPFVRPTIRAYVSSLAGHDRTTFRKQLRAVFDSDAAFHIKRLVAESLAEQQPQDDDWSLIRHLHRKHRELFNSLYQCSTLHAWHYFWLKYLIPCAIAEHDEQSLAMHVHRIAAWQRLDPAGVLSFWAEMLKLDWLDQDRIARTIGYALGDFDSTADASAEYLIRTLLRRPQQKHDCLGKAVSRCLATGGATDELLWQYITGDVSNEDVLGHHFDQKLRCQPHEFKEDTFLESRMLGSDALLECAIADTERWSALRNETYSRRVGFREGFLTQTSYDAAHSNHAMQHVSAETVLFNAMQRAILQHAKLHSAWWVAHREHLCRSDDGAIRYFAMLAVTEFPGSNTAQASSLLLDKELQQARLHFEIATLLQAAFFYLNDTDQERVLAVVLTWQHNDDLEPSLWVLRERAELLSAIPACLRSPGAQAVLDAWEATYGSCVRLPQIHSSGGMVVPPFSYERFLEMSDHGAIRILAHYQSDLRRDYEYESLVGGAEQVERQLSEAASRSPTRFLRFLDDRWADIPERFTDDILDGAATYLAHRHGRLQFDAAHWIPVEEPDASSLASSILDEIERHPVRWRHNRSAAKALAACATVILNADDASRLLFAATGFAGCPEARDDEDSIEQDLVSVGINMIRGDAAQAALTVAVNFAKANLPFPELLVPTLTRFALDLNPAVRAVIVRELPYLQSISPTLGWKLFGSALRESDERLWTVAEPCLYYGYHKRFAAVSVFLNEIAGTGKGKSLKTWGRISGLAVLSDLIELPVFISQLRALSSYDAWCGATSVWAANAGNLEHSAKCFEALMIGLSIDGITRLSVARGMNRMFRDNGRVTLVPTSVVDLYFSALEGEKSDERVNLYGFDDWLNLTCPLRPDETLESTERFAMFVERTKHRLYDHGAVSKLMTSFFREAEEREESDAGIMLKRVIAIQDKFLAIGIHGLDEWLRDAERP